MQSQIFFAADLNWIVWSILGALGFFALACLLWLRPKGWLLRILALSALLFACLEPQLHSELREPEKTVVAIVVDKSDSQNLANRSEQSAQLVKQVEERLAQIENIETRIVEFHSDVQSSEISTALFTKLASTIEDVPVSRMGGAIFITDGQVHDATKASLSLLSREYPIHALVTGSDDEIDRQIKIETAPRFGLIDESQEITFRVEDKGPDSQSNERTEVELRLDGKLIDSKLVRTGQLSSFDFELSHAGRSLIELSVAPIPNELTLVNNRTIQPIDAIRENLRVLLVSGEPHAGERTWRSLLKSDINVDLVHFTILRPPEKRDNTALEELALVPFPADELFLEKIDEFDLIIFDRYQQRGVLNSFYFDSIVQYVKRGGAFLMASGPEFTEARSMATSVISDILPALPTGQVQSAPYRPQLTELGLKHPVTKSLEGANTKENEAKWGRWLRLIDSQIISGQTLMSDENGSPLLVIDEVDEGRVGLFLSDHPWLWSRGFDGGGPHVDLLRKLTHWLLNEPELEAEKLSSNFADGVLTISRQTLNASPNSVSITAPNGETIDETLSDLGNGEWAFEIENPAFGYWQFSHDDFTQVTHIGPTDALEYAEILSTTEILAPVLKEFGGKVMRAANKLPRIAMVTNSSRTSGSNWIGLKRTEDTALRGAISISLAQGLIALAVFLGLLGFTWYREGR